MLKSAHFLKKQVEIFSQKLVYSIEVNFSIIFNF